MTDNNEDKEKEREREEEREKERKKEREREICNESPTYKRILYYERNTSEEAISKVIKKPQVSLWMIFFPIVFLPFIWQMERYKKTTYGFRDGYVYTKEIALNIAYKLHTKKITEEEAHLEIERIIKTQPDPDAMVLAIFEKQIAEVHILYRHYLALLNSYGDTYAQLVSNHYKSYDRFVEFLNELDKAETEVTNAAKPTFRTDVEELPELIEKIETSIREYRLEEAKRIFS